MNGEHWSGPEDDASEMYSDLLPSTDVDDDVSLGFVTDLAPCRRAAGGAEPDVEGHRQNRGHQPPAGGQPGVKWPGGGREHGQDDPPGCPAPSV